MARVDSLLGILVEQGANELRLGVDREPEMYQFGARKRLALAATSADVLRGLLGDLFSQEKERSLAEQRTLDLVHDVPGLGPFHVAFTARQGTELPLEFDVVFMRGPGAPVRTPSRDVPQAREAPNPAPPSASDASDLVRLVSQAVAERASDVHLMDGQPAVLRRDGRLAALAESRDVSLRVLLAPWLSDSILDGAMGGRAHDAALELEGVGRIRLNVYRSSEGLAAAIRILPSRVPALRDLGFPIALDDLVMLPHGLVIVCGPTGCGKSTTLAALADEALRRRGSLVIALEDPIEYELSPKGGRGLVRQRQVGRDVESFAAGLRDGLREDPDVLLIGEMRDAETIALALTAAETGHLVLASMHSRSSASAVERIIDVYSGDQKIVIRAQLADSLRAVISQRLIPRARTAGRAVALEILRVNHAVAALVREGRLAQVPNAIQAGKREGMLSLERSLADLVRSGDIDVDDARATANDITMLESFLAGPSGA